MQPDNLSKENPAQPIGERVAVADQPQMVTVKLDAHTLSFLRVLGDPSEVLQHLAHAAAEGVRRPGSWERGWLEQSGAGLLYGEEGWQEKLAVDPQRPYARMPPSAPPCGIGLWLHGRSTAGDPDFPDWTDDPADLPAPTVCRWYRRAEKGPGWVMAACPEHGAELVKLRFRPGNASNLPPADMCPLCIGGATLEQVRRCSCESAPSRCPEHRPGRGTVVRRGRHHVE